MSDEDQVHPDEETHEEPLSVRDELVNAWNAQTEKDEELPKAVKESKTESEEIKETPEKSLNAEPTLTEKTEKPAIQPPVSWNAEAKKEWATLKPSIQAEIARREEEVHKGFTKHDEERNYGKSLKEVITPYMPLIQADAGGDAVAAIKGLLNSAYVLKTGSPQDKGRMIMYLAGQYGIDIPSYLQQQNSQAPAQNQVDPRVQQLDQRLSVYEQRVQQEEHQKAILQNQEVQSAIDKFAADPKNVHFQLVMPHMAALLKSGLAQDMADAYDQAVYARPDLRTSLIEQQTATAIAKRQEEAKQKTKAARNAAISVRGAPGSAVPNKAERDVSTRDLLVEQFKEHGLYH